MANTLQTVLDGYNTPWRAGAQSLFASAQVNGAANGTLVPELGHGLIHAEVNVSTKTALTDGTDEIYVYLDGNTRAASTTWLKFACLRLDGTIVDTAAKFPLTGYNTGDYQVRIAFTIEGAPDCVIDAAAYNIRDKVGI